MPVIIENEGAGRMRGLIHYKDDSEQVDLAGYRLEVSYRGESKGGGYGLVIATGPDEFLVAGSGVSIHFAARTAGPRHTRFFGWRKADSRTLSGFRAGE